MEVLHRGVCRRNPEEIGANPLRAQFEGHELGQHVQAGLRGAISRPALDRRRRRAGSGVDDDAAGLAQQRGGGALTRCAPTTLTERARLSELRQAIEA